MSELVRATAAGEKGPNSPPSAFTDPVLAAVLGNRLEAIVREMTNTVLRSARSVIVSNGRDFSCAIVSANGELLSVADGLPVHTFNSHMQAANIPGLHNDLAEGDAFIDNDPYTGNTHPADQTVMVPVFVDGEHLFTACAKAHQADIGNSLPTTYHPFAKDVYEEGAIIFPCMRLQRNGRLIDDVIRLGMRRIRVPEQWRGDLLATLGAARIAEQRLKELCREHGTANVKTFIKEWLDYSERLMASRIAALPQGRFDVSSNHDPVPVVLPDGITVKAIIEVDPAAGEIRVDLRHNDDCVKAGFNQTEATARSSVMAAIYHSLGTGLPRNSGAFRRIKVLLRENSVVGIPRFPASCSIATTNVADRLVNLIQSTLAGLGNNIGLAEGGLCMGVNSGVISGQDFRNDCRPYISQLTLASNGGPASPFADGWGTYGIPAAAGLTYRDSVEINEIKFPIIIDHLRLVPGSGGAGAYRGGLAVETRFRVREGTMTVVTNSDGQVFAPKGALGGQPGALGASWLIEQDGREKRIAGFGVHEIRKGQALRGTTNGGGGFGDPAKRDTALVLQDVVEARETVERAHSLYQVVLTGDAKAGTFAIDHLRTARLRGAPGN
ncbi:hydantoinase B/oxoprolinase family protein [Bradyrhizobium sp. CW9]|uniref:hydantoinase B/oxoprolinase family protein n=1 Tax=Bradyrhizobium sp. CW9 TaxID=2782689 RepID=UPI001FF8FBEB|nr:hydantoinase B/oxoprolinase family protein [Bradyrhizobium sp. CW9]MCK1328962.1 hydantoinase B/oxoprolinase family protein [Bradyrhizobium sp. CW9]